MTVTLTIQGMSCQHCVNRVKKAIDGLTGILKSDVQVGKATIDFDSALITAVEINKAVEEAGYPVASLQE